MTTAAKAVSRPGPRLGHFAARQRPDPPVYDVPHSSPTGRDPRRTVPDTR